MERSTLLCEIYTPMYGKRSIFNLKNACKILIGKEEVFII